MPRKRAGPSRRLWAYNAEGGGGGGGMMREGRRGISGGVGTALAGGRGSLSMVARFISGARASSNQNQIHHHNQLRSCSGPGPTRMEFKTAGWSRRPQPRAAAMLQSWRLSLKELEGAQTSSITQISMHNHDHPRDAQALARRRSAFAPNSRTFFARGAVLHIIITSSMSSHNN